MQCPLCARPSLRRASAWWMLVAVCLVIATTSTAQRTLRILHPVDQRPLDHINHNGLSEDVLSDYWHVWSTKTGIPVEFRSGLFQDCLRQVRESSDTVLSGIYYSVDNDAMLDLSQRMISIKNTLFARQGLGLRSLDEAAEYTIGVVTGDAAEAFLHRHRPGIALKRFATSEDLIRYVVDQNDLDVFALDYPSAMHLLDGRRALNRFDAVQTLFVGRVCAAVGDNQGSLLLEINRGIDMVSEAEVEALFDRHLPHPWVFPRWATRYVVATVALLLLLGGITHVTVLKRTVRRRTSELREKNDRLREEMTVRHKVEEALAEQNRKLQEMNQELDRLASTDALTGLYNRRHLMDRLAQELERSTRYGNPLSVLLLDLDHFKSINDSHGHLVGDAVLKRAGEIIQDCARTTDLPGRYGGEEFALLLPQTDTKGASELAERLRRRLGQMVHHDAAGKPFHVTCSIGVASVHGNGNATWILKHADDALYQAKADGRNRVRAVVAETEEFST
ncbi:MAG: diguanylate cyclase [Candidatus Hydrogenedentes bacterium]|nr:diguanylate cyclase [Candidatus Hydrogenedentota bacterium]